MLLPNTRYTNLVVAVALDLCNMSTADFVDIAQTFVLALVAVAQIYTILILRKNSGARPRFCTAWSTAMGEQSDLKRDGPTDLEGRGHGVDDARLVGGRDHERRLNGA